MGKKLELELAAHHWWLKNILLRGDRQSHRWRSMEKNRANYHGESTPSVRSSHTANNLDCQNGWIYRV